MLQRVFGDRIVHSEAAKAKLNNSLNSSKYKSAAVQTSNYNSKEQQAKLQVSRHLDDFLTQFQITTEDIKQFYSNLMQEPSSKNFQEKKKFLKT